MSGQQGQWHDAAQVDGTRDLRAGTHVGLGSDERLGLAGVTGPQPGRDGERTRVADVGRHRRDRQLLRPSSQRPRRIGNWRLRPDSLHQPASRRPTVHREVIARVSTIFNRYPDRFLFGTDTVAPASPAAYYAVFDMWKPVWSRLTADASQKIRIGNYERIFDQGHRRVRAWEKANAK